MELTPHIIIMSTHPGYYYDINEKDNFDTLLSGTDIGKNPTTRKNSYYILKFDFSDIETDFDKIIELYKQGIRCAM